MLSFGDLEFSLIIFWKDVQYGLYRPQIAMVIEECGLICSLRDRFLCCIISN